MPKRSHKYKGKKAAGLDGKPAISFNLSKNLQCFVISMNNKINIFDKQNLINCFLVNYFDHYLLFIFSENAANI